MLVYLGQRRFSTELNRAICSFVAWSSRFGVFTGPFGEAAQSGTPQPVVSRRSLTTIHRTLFLPHFCVEKKIYPVPGGTKRYQPARSGTARPIPRSEFRIPHFRAPRAYSLLALECFQRTPIPNQRNRPPDRHQHPHSRTIPGKIKIMVVAVLWTFSAGPSQRLPRLWSATPAPPARELVRLRRGYCRESPRCRAGR